MVFYSTKVSKFSVCFTLKAHLKVATFQVLDSPAHRGQHPLYWTTQHQRGVREAAAGGEASSDKPGV